MKNYIAILLLVLATTAGFAQDDPDEVDDNRSNIQKFTPSKLVGPGTVDIKIFNNIFTSTSGEFNGVDANFERQNFFTTTFEVFVGVGQILGRDINVGLIGQLRSNTIGGQSLFSVFNFSGDENSRSGFTRIAPAVRVVPFPKLTKSLSYQFAIFIPLIDNETENGVFLDQDSFITQNRVFYDYVFPGDKWQLFTEINTEFSFGNEAEFDPVTGAQIEGSFANNSLRFIPAVVFSYFPSSKVTISALFQHQQLLDLGNDFSQNLTSAGAGLKIQISKPLNIEFLYSNFFRGSNTQLGDTFNVGIRGIF